MVDSSIPFRPNHDAIAKRSMHSLLEAARNAEEDYRKHRDGHRHPRHTSKREPANVRAGSGRRGAWARPTDSSTVFFCSSCHDTTLQCYRLPVSIFIGRFRAGCRRFRPGSLLRAYRYASS